MSGDDRPIFHIRPVREGMGFNSFGPHVSGMDVERRERQLAQVKMAGARVEDVPLGESFHEYWPKECRRCNAPVDKPWEQEDEVDPDMIF